MSLDVKSMHDSKLRRKCEALTRYAFKKVAMLGDRALKNCPIPHQTMLTSLDVTAQRV
jgi:hypothetical protein